MENDVKTPYQKSVNAFMIWQEYGVCPYCMHDHFNIRKTSIGKPDVHWAVSCTECKQRWRSPNKYE